MIPPNGDYLEKMNQPKKQRWQHGDINGETSWGYDIDFYSPERSIMAMENPP
jgi:hypothetical protein